MSTRDFYTFQYIPIMNTLKTGSPSKNTYELDNFNIKTIRNELKDKNISAYGKLVYYSLLPFWDGNNIQLSLKEIIEETKINKRTLIKALSELESAFFLSKITANGNTSKYILNILNGENNE